MFPAEVPMVVMGAEAGILLFGPIPICLLSSISATKKNTKLQMAPEEMGLA
jgi:hypothetical protein